MTQHKTSAAVVLGAATVLTGLMAGVFFIFACAVMPGLARSGDPVYVETVRDINEVILNPLFLLAYLGALPLTGWSAWQSRREPYRRWVWAALAAYAVVFLVTSAANVPLNDALANAGDPAAAREEFEGPWTAWNAVRAAFSALALVCLVRALLGHGRPGQPSAYFDSADGSRASR